MVESAICIAVYEGASSARRAAALQPRCTASVSASSPSMSRTPHANALVLPKTEV
jgi:hypothetical protein